MLCLYFACNYIFSGTDEVPYLLVQFSTCWWIYLPKCCASWEIHWSREPVRSPVSCHIQFFWTLCGNAYDYSFVVLFSVSTKKQLISLCDDHWKPCGGIYWAGMFWSLMMLMSTVSPTWRAVIQAFVSIFFMSTYTRTKPITMQWQNAKLWKFHKYGGLCLNHESFKYF